MKYIAYLFWFTLVLTSYGTDSRYSKLDGRLLHLDQDEFYVYSPDGIIDRMDTIRVTGRRFTYEIPYEKPGTLLVVFSNFSEHPAFAELGKKIEVKENASYLKKLEAREMDDNKLMAKFRKGVANTSPPEVLKYAEQFVDDHPSLGVGGYFASKYFPRTPKPNCLKAKQLVDIMVRK